VNGFSQQDSLSLNTLEDCPDGLGDTLTGGVFGCDHDLDPV
jgi:hypothetical protein